MTSTVEREAMRHRVDDDDMPVQCRLINDGVGPVRDHCPLCNHRLDRIAQERAHDARIRNANRSCEWLRD